MKNYKVIFKGCVREAIDESCGQAFNPAGGKGRRRGEAANCVRCGCTFTRKHRDHVICEEGCMTIPADPVAVGNWLNANVDSHCIHDHAKLYELAALGVKYDAERNRLIALVGEDVRQVSAGVASSKEFGAMPKGGKGIVELASGYWHGFTGYVLAGALVELLRPDYDGHRGMSGRGFYFRACVRGLRGGE